MRDDSRRGSCRGVRRGPEDKHSIAKELYILQVKKEQAQS